MTTPSASRRRFIGAAGVALSAPLTGLGVTAVDAATSIPAPIDDVGAIRTLLHEYARGYDAIMRGIGRVVPDGFGTDRIDVAPDGTATAALRCIVETDAPIGPDCPLVAMAREQGGGVVRLREPGVLEVRYVKRDGKWTFDTGDFRADP